MRVYGKCRLLVTTLRHLPYIISYKSKNVVQILALKTRGRLICLSSFGQQLFQDCLCKSMADNCREMLAKCWQSGLMMATVDDTESAVDALMLIGKEQCSLPLVFARCHRPQTTHLLSPPPHHGWSWRCLGIACTPPDALPSPGVLYKHHP